MKSLARIAAIAGNTFREALRDKVLLTLIVIAVLVTAAARVIPPLAVGEGAKIAKDLGLASMTLFCVLIAVLVGGRLVWKEIEKRTIFTLLAKPVRRAEFILGKYGGLMLVLLVSVAVMTLWYGLFLVLTRVPLDPALLLPIGMLVLELAMVTAVATLFSTFTTPISSTVFAFAIYFAGNMSRDLLNLAAMNKSVVVKLLARLCYYVLPNIRDLDFRAAVVHGHMLIPAQVSWAVAYSLLYTAAILLLAVLVFQRRNF
jgi:ABC-type transport system involved in multi-copper enzyme maturation permease subunit